jgi:hypothetical protein
MYNLGCFIVHLNLHWHFYLDWARYRKALARDDHQGHVVYYPADHRPTVYLHARLDQCNVKFAPQAALLTKVFISAFVHEIMVFT